MAVAYGIVFVFLPEPGSKPIDASSTVEEKRVKVVGDRIPIQTDQGLRRRTFLEGCLYDNPNKRTCSVNQPLPQEEEGDGNPFGHTG